MKLRWYLLLLLVATAVIFSGCTELSDNEQQIVEMEETNTTKEDAETCYNKGIELYNMDKYEEAIGAYDKAIELDPQDPAAWNNKGIVFGDLGRHEEAVICYNKALEIMESN